MKVYTLTITQEQLDILAGFMNETLKSAGIGAVRQAAIGLDALETAKEVTDEPQADEPDDGA